MIKIFTFIILISCASKYETHHFIDKRTFKLDKVHTTINPRLRAGKKEKAKFCAGQILFNQNAKKITDSSLKRLLTRTCPGKTHLLNAKLTQTWWTTIIYSRSCLEIEASCPL